MVKIKHKLKNIANRALPVEGKLVVPGQIVQVELTSRLKYLIKNKFFKDLGLVNEQPNQERSTGNPGLQHKSPGKLVKSKKKNKLKRKKVMN